MVRRCGGPLCVVIYALCVVIYAPCVELYAPHANTAKHTTGAAETEAVTETTKLTHRVSKRGDRPHSKRRPVCFIKVS